MNETREKEDAKMSEITQEGVVVKSDGANGTAKQQSNVKQEVDIDIDVILADLKKPDQPIETILSTLMSILDKVQGEQE